MLRWFDPRVGPVWTTDLRGGSERSRPQPPTTAYLHLKAMLDIGLALTTLLLLLPILLLVAVAIKLDSRGPVFYRQARIGRDRRRGGGEAWPRALDRRCRNLHGRPFRIFKFRTMVLDAEAATGPVWAAGHTDPRTTRLGPWLRSSHLDEWPQLLNVLFGQMSLVGPRPERPEIAVELAKQVAGFAHRTAVRPGIAGLAQAVGTYDQTVDDVFQKVHYDLQYIANLGWSLDVRIAFASLWRCWIEFSDYRRSRLSSDAGAPAPAPSSAAWRVTPHLRSDHEPSRDGGAARPAPPRRVSGRYAVNEHAIKRSSA